MERKLSISIAVFFAAAVAIATLAFAQTDPDRGWGRGSRYAMMYNPQTEETLTGEVARVDKFTPMRGMSAGIHLLVKAGKETISVHLGPAGYIESQELQFAAGDKVEVTGSRITVEGQPAIIAAAVKKGNQVLKLRDDKGVPTWSGWRRPH
jgi:hypothetical protein